MINRIKDRFKDKILQIEKKNARRIYININPDDIVAVAEFMFKELEMRFIIASGMDKRGTLEILYHFSIDNTGEIISIRVDISKDNPEIESLAPGIKAAEWIEREMHELLGIKFKGHPDLKRLLLDDDWPEGEYPLRKKI